MIALLHAASDRVNRATELVLVPLVAFFVGVVLVAVLTRYVFNVAIVESIELTRLSFNWACFLGAAVAVKRADHVRIVILVQRFPPRLRQIVAVLVQAMMAGFFCLMIVEGWGLFDTVKRTVFPALGWSQGLLYLSLPISGAIMLLHTASALARAVAGLAGVTDTR